MRAFISVLLLLFLHSGAAVAGTAQGTAKFTIKTVWPTCNADFDPVLNLNPVPHANGVVEHPEITISVTCDRQGLLPWLRLTHSESIEDLYKVRMQPNLLLLAFKEKSSQKYVIYNSTDSAVTDPSMTGMIGGQSHDYKVELIPVTEIDSHAVVTARDGSTLVGVELYYK
ncbi:hypothetical protein [Escherichia coli]|uniref:hypothetical protein n=1 Tax=Escherichia coli TaxID=562 RepID=UPI000E69AB41|nr:hypothetical protein [Escherichia coli]RIW25582.1 hypothetical protein D3C97_23045 [Escherichia coli]